MRRSFLLICALALSGCAADRPRFQRAERGGAAGMAGPAALFVSPAGEPFRRGERAEPPIRAWFAQADGDSDGALSWAEFEADFTRYFTLLDADRDGEIGPAEVTRYETEILPEMASRGFGAGPRGGGGMGRGGGGMGRGGGGRGGMGGGRGGGPGGARPGAGSGRGAGMAMMSGAARFGLLPIPHPIMDADADFNRGVTRAEFARAAARRFALLDEARDGRLALAGLLAQRLRGRAPGRGQPHGAD